MKYTDEQKRFLYSVFCEKLEKALDNENLGNAFLDGRDDGNVPIWKNLCFMLDKYNSGEFFGSLAFKVIGFKCSDVFAEKQTFKVDGEYLSEDRELEKLGA